MTTELKPCPFCGGTKVYLMESQQGVCDGYVVCDGCRAEGPCGVTDDEARRLWNERAERRDEA